MENRFWGDQSGFKFRSFIDEEFFKTIPVKNLAPHCTFTSAYFPTPFKAWFFLYLSY